MTKSGLLTKYEALEKVEEILKTFEEEVYKELNCTNENDTKIRVLAEGLSESIENSHDEKYDYKDVVVIFNSSKKLAEAYKLSWQNKPCAEGENIENKKLKLLNPETGLAELKMESREDIIRYMAELEEEDYKELLRLTPQKYREFFSTARTNSYYKSDKSIATYEDVCSMLDDKAQQLVIISIPKLGELQKFAACTLSVAEKFFLNHNKAYFLYIPGLIGKGLHKLSCKLIELDIQSLAGNIVFAKRVLESLRDFYFSEDEELKRTLLNDSMENLTDEGRSEIKKFIKSDHYESLKKEILFSINIDELNETAFQGYFYDEGKKKFVIKSPGFTPQNLVRLDLMKDGVSSYALNLLKGNVLEIDLGTNLGKDFKIGDMLVFGFGNDDKTAEEFSAFVSGLRDFYDEKTKKQLKNLLWNAIEETKAEVSDYVSMSKGNTDASVGVTVSADGLKETVGVRNVLYENKDSKVTLTNTGTVRQDFDGKFESMHVQSEIRKTNDESTLSSSFHFLSDSEKKSILTSLGLSLCLSELQKKTYMPLGEALLKFGITYSKPDVTKSNNTVNIKTTLSVGSSNTDFNLGFQIDTSSFSNSKMILTYSLRGL